MTTQVYDFPVELQDLHTADGKKANRKAIVRTDTNKILSDVSDKYKIINHNEIFSVIEEYITKLGKPTIKYSSINNGARIIGEYTFREVGVDVKVGDTVGLRVYSLSTYDGKSSAQLKVGGLRLSCLNGMVTSRDDFNLSFRHMGDHIQDGKITNLVLPNYDDILLSFKASATKWKRLAEIDLSDTDVLTYREKAIEEGAISPRVREIGQQLEEQTAWGLYNQFTHHITHNEKASAQVQGKITRYNKVENWFNEVFA